MDTEAYKQLRPIPEVENSEIGNYSIDRGKLNIVAHGLDCENRIK